ncbi:uncharacterized protein BJ212DRAFT_1473961 [Suillus subaureus]|uniref:Secreted protein n=1 Tax=Suillus subaureus TaxID=48587 RepID=A0A9P7EN56_9AGAM|nr:uncharacterized protein BJ212DRAFT_1473961 [Suillus subaureus]KAG1826728.1 hypothetical protein BJ212DRAFT_1473961 [Suillus subaureus]
MAMVTVLGILLLVIVRVRRHNDRYACRSLFSRFPRRKESSDDDLTVSISPSCPTVVGLSSTKGFPMMHMTITPPTPAQAPPWPHKRDSYEKDEVRQLSRNSHSEGMVAYGAHKGLGSSTFEAKSFPHPDQSQPSRTAPGGWHTYFHLATHWTILVVRTTRTIHPHSHTALSPSPRRASRKSHPVQKVVDHSAVARDPEHTPSNFPTAFLLVRQSQ